MYFVTEQDFNSIPYNIPDSQDGPNTLKSVVDFFEEEALKKCLGSVLYRQLLEGVFVDPDVAEPVMKAEGDIEQKWKDLRDGAQYEYKLKQYRYDGLVNFIKPYVYQAWIEEHVHDLTAIGTIQPDTENGFVVSPGRLISDAYRKFAKAVGNCNKFNDSLWGFLKANEIAYPDWSFEEPGSRNVLSI